MFDGRPNSELILATGRVEDDSPADHLTVSVGLVPADRMFSTKKEILKNLGFEAVQVLLILLQSCFRLHARHSSHLCFWHKDRWALKTVRGSVRV